MGFNSLTGVKPWPPASGAQSPNHWATREVSQDTVMGQQAHKRQCNNNMSSITRFQEWITILLTLTILLKVQFSSFQSQSCPTLCSPMNSSTPGLSTHHQLPEFTQTHVHQVGDAIQPSHPLSSHSPPAPNPSQHQSLFQWVSSSHQVAKVLEFQLQHQSLQWIFRTDFL